MSGNHIYMNYFSRLGPIDPQVETREGRTVPALGYLRQYERLVKKARKGTITLAETQVMLDNFDQAELFLYEQAAEQSVSLLKKWLAEYKFKDWKETETQKLQVDDAMRTKRAKEIAKQLTDTERWHSHGHGISPDVLRNELNLKIDDFDADPKLKAAVTGYHELMVDYLSKTGHGAIHVQNAFTLLHF